MRCLVGPAGTISPAATGRKPAVPRSEHSGSGHRPAGHAGTTARRSSYIRADVPGAGPRGNAPSARHDRGLPSPGCRLIYVAGTQPVWPGRDLPDWPELNGARDLPVLDERRPEPFYREATRPGQRDLWLEAREFPGPCTDGLMGTSAAKRRREQDKLDKAKAKAGRKAARRATDAATAGPPSLLSEPELIEELGALHRAVEAGDLSPGDFEERRDRLQAQFQQLSR